MRFQQLYDFNWIDPVQTEEKILSNLRYHIPHINSSFIIAYHSWSASINTLGIESTQKIINTFLSKQLKGHYLIFVCQHISVEKLDWGNSIVFTPHATHQNKFYPVAHFSTIYSDDKVRFLDRPLLASFVGSYATHIVRKSIANILSIRKDCFTYDTGSWHYDKSSEDKIQFQLKYKHTLKNSKFVLCPLGTGPSTIRIWEALSSGSIPIIISDNLKLPAPIAASLPTVPLSLIDLLPTLLEHLSDPEYLAKFELLQQKVYGLHTRLTNNTSLHQPVLNYILNA